MAFSQAMKDIGASLVGATDPDAVNLAWRLLLLGRLLGRLLSRLLSGFLDCHGD